MIHVSYSSLFQCDLESVTDWLYSFAINNGKNPNRIVEDFKQELTHQVVLIQQNPFIKPAYGLNNPTRRAVLFFGNFILEYQIIPTGSKFKNLVTEVILTALVPSRSGKYGGAFEDLENFEF
jgi:hypothetical protein